MGYDKNKRKVRALGFSVGTGSAEFAAATASGLGLQRVAHVIYDFSVDGGSISTIVPAKNAIIPANAIVFGGLINSTTAPVGAGATIAIGTSAGSNGTSLKAPTAIATYSLDAILATVPVFTAASSFKMSAAGSVNLTIATTALTAAVIEIFVVYFHPVNA